MHGDQADHSEQHKQQGPDGAFLLGGPPQQEEEEKSKQERSKKTRRHLQLFFNGILAATTVILALLTGYQAYVSRRAANISTKQWEVMKGQLEQMKGGSAQTDRLIEKADSIAKTMVASNVQQKAAMNETMRQNRDALAKTIAQSKTALDASIESSRFDQRAWLSIAGVQTTGGNITNGKFTFKSVTIVIRNTGKTPAIDVNRACCYLTTEPFFAKTVPSFDGETENARLHKTRGTLISNVNSTTFIEGISSFPPNTAFEETLIDLESVYLPLDAQSIVYLVGKVTYRDVFDGTKPHTTTVCVMNKMRATFVVCPTGIQMD